jgi:hypothetical protein
MANTFQVRRINGDNGERFVGVSAAGEEIGSVQETIDVAAGTATLTVTLTSGSPADFQRPDGVAVVLRDPDGKAQQPISQGVAQGYFLIVVESPKAGAWSLEVKTAEPQTFACEVRSLPDISTTETTARDAALTSLAAFAAQLLGGREIQDRIEALALDGGCHACAIGIAIALVAVGIVVLVIAVALGILTAKFPPLLIIAAAVAKLGIRFTAEALASLIVNIINGGERNPDNMARRMCVSFGACR